MLLYKISSTIIIISQYLLFWLILFSSFDLLSKHCTSIFDRNMSVKEIDGSVLEGVSN